MSDQYTPTGGQTIFPRINFLKTFSSRLEQRIANGRVFLGGIIDPLFGDATFDLDFTKAKSIGDLITFSRASTGTYVGSDGLIKTAAVDEPRFDHDPVTGESLGLLIEESRTNQFTHSDFGDSSWETVDITKKSTNNIAPDGTNTAVLIGDANSTASVLKGVLDLVGGGVQTFTYYAKGTTAGQSTFVDYFDGGSNRSRGSISLDDGSVAYDQQTGDAVITATDVGNGWWRCQLTLTPNGTFLWNWRAGNNNSGDIYIWGAMVEAGSFPTSYIPTSGSAVTRAADVSSITGTNFSSWYTQGKGSFVVKADRYDALPATKFNVLTTDGFRLPEFSFTGTGHATIFATGTTTYTPPTPLLKANFGWSFDATSVSKYINGVGATTAEVVTDSNTALYLGNHLTTAHWHNGHISRLAYFPSRKTDQELIDLTT